MSKYTEEFKASIVKKALLLDQKTSLLSFSRDLEINKSTIRGWKNKYKFKLIINLKNVKICSKMLLITVMQKRDY